MPRPALEIALTANELFSPFEICQSQARRAKELAEKLQNQKVTISVIGQFKRGKSTLVNAILEDDILPVGIVPVTAAVTEIRYGEKAADVLFNNGVVKPVEFKDLHEYINEQENPKNVLGVSSVTMYAPSPFLEDGITFVDTPGVGSVHQNNTDAAYAFVKESDGVIFMLSVDSPINQIEIDFLKNAKEYASKFYFAVNKVDVISEEDLKAYMEYCKNLLKDIMEVEDVTIFPVSARTGYGIKELKDTITYDTKHSIKEILESSVKMKLVDLMDDAMKQIKLYRNALSMPIEDLDQGFKKINEAIDLAGEKTREKVLEHQAKREELLKGLEEEIEPFKTMAPEMVGEIYRKYAISLKAYSFIRAGELEAFVNETKNGISKEVSDLFGIDYRYDISKLDYMKQNMTMALDGDDLDFEKLLDETMAKLDSQVTDEIKGLCDELRDTLNAIFMYREENAFIVIRRIEDLNKLVRHLRSLRVKI
ncbi:MAG: dynamin family protein [Clostridia bacterium]|nr:dynamin family protein [Clostridia bacterium]